MTWTKILLVAIAISAAPLVPGTRAGADPVPATLTFRPPSCVDFTHQAGAVADSAQSPDPASTAAPAPTRIVPAVPNAAAASIPHTADSTLVRDLRKGGYILFFRHAMTNWNERDGREGDFADRAKQRNLSEVGKTQAADLGKAITALKIPIEKVLASPMWRCRDTAQLAFGAYDTTIMLFWKGPKFREARIKMLGTPPPAGKNLVLVGHQDQFIPIVPGLQRDQLKEGDALVFQPLGDGKYRVVTQVTPAEWAKLAGTKAPPANEPPPAEGLVPPLPSPQAGPAFDSPVPPRAIDPRKVKK